MEKPNAQSSESLLGFMIKLCMNYSSALLITDDSIKTILNCKCISITPPKMHETRTKNIRANFWAGLMAKDILE